MAFNVHDDSQSHTVVAISIVFAILTAFVLGLRLFARYYVIRTLSLVDVLMIGACILSWAFIAATILAAQHGLGQHIEVVMAKGPANFKQYLQIVWLSSMFYNACLCLIKLSVLFLYVGLGDPSLRRAAYIMIVIVGCQGFANVLTCAFQCSPVRAAWDLTVTNGKCINIDAFYLTNAALNITTDIMTYCLPLKMAWGLALPNKQKIILSITFGLGFFACVSSIVRITFVPAMLTNPDATWAITAPMYWSVIETNVGILATSIPSFKALAHRFLPRILGETSWAGRYNSKGGTVTEEEDTAGDGGVQLVGRHERKGPDLELNHVGGGGNGDGLGLGLKYNDSLGLAAAHDADSEKESRRSSGESGGGGVGEEKQWAMNRTPPVRVTSPALRTWAD